MLKSLAFAVLLTTGCFYSGKVVHRQASDVETDVMAVQGDCGMSFRSDPSIQGLVDDGARRWAKATGCEVTSDADGVVPVHVSDHVFNAYRWTTGEQWTTTDWVEDPEVGYFEVCGNTEVTFHSETQHVISIDIYVAMHGPKECGSSTAAIGRIVLHEMGHALMDRDQRHPSTHVESQTLMNAYVDPVSSICAEDLTLICSTLQCTTFNPEACQ